MKALIIINGLPRAGKDTVAHYVANILAAEGFIFRTTSSIDPVRKMLESNGIDVTAKTEMDRRVMAEIGDLLEEHSAYRSDYCIRITNRVLRMSMGLSNCAVILHIREPKIIERVIEGVKATHPYVKAVTLFVDSDRGERVTSNAADRGVFDMKYDYTITNNGTLDDLNEACVKFTRDVGLA